MGRVGVARADRAAVPPSAFAQKDVSVTLRTTPPFRADHVGSFLRPKYLLEARERKTRGEINAAELRAVEDRAIAEVVKMQEEIGLSSITDGEFRRTYFHIDFLQQLGGVKTGEVVTTRRADGTEELTPPVMSVIDKVRHVKDIQRADFEYLKGMTRRTPKVTIPSPTMLHFRGGRAGISRDHYPDLDEFYQDTANAYGDELRSLAAAGCTYVQMDDTNLAYLCDPKMQEAARSRGDDPAELPHRYCVVHQSRRSAEARWNDPLHASLPRQFQEHVGGAGRIRAGAEALLSEMNVDGYFLEYDDERSGDFKPLRFLPKGKTVVLGLVTTKFGTMESKDALKRRIDDASRYAPLEQLALSPQCGFSSTVHGNAIAMEAQAAKLRLVVDVASEVWGTA
jgi:5-methyltetrahydropteroyltriglutamate--homocysteine methyltransferase